MPKNEPAEDEVQIVIPGVDTTLVKRVEKLAKKENRSRAAQLRVLIEEAVTKRERDLQVAEAA